MELADAALGDPEDLADLAQRQVVDVEQNGDLALAGGQALKGLAEALLGLAGDGELLETLTALRDDGYAGFASLEPHLAEQNAFGGFSGAEAFGRAAQAFAGLTASIAVLTCSG